MSRCTEKVATKMGVRPIPRFPVIVFHSSQTVLLCILGTSESMPHRLNISHKKMKHEHKLSKRSEYPRCGGKISRTSLTVIFPEVRIRKEAEIGLGSMKFFGIQWQNYDGEGKLGRRKALSRWDGYSPDSQSASPSSLVCPCVTFYSTTK